MQKLDLKRIHKAALGLYIFMIVAVQVISIWLLATYHSSLKIHIVPLLIGSGLAILFLWIANRVFSKKYVRNIVKLPHLLFAAFISSFILFINEFTIENQFLDISSRYFFIGSVIGILYSIFRINNNKETKVIQANKFIRVFSFLFFLGMFLFSLGISAVIFSKNHIQHISQSRVYEDVSEIPENYVAIVLGTSRYNSFGNENPYFHYRIEAAAELFHAKKCQYILVSGDNRRHTYNEPLMMKKALMKKGIPEERIILDYAGFRTLDSMVRSKKIFGQKKITVVSQQFHSERAIFISSRNGIDAIAFEAKNVSVSYGRTVMIRESFARVKALLDIYILKTQPYFLGEQIKIG